MEDLLSAAVVKHQAGELLTAAQLYQQILAREETNPDALHLLGVLRHQQGDHGRAVELIARAVALQPNVAAFHANLAEAYRAQGHLERAAGSCRMALRLWPDYPEAHCNLGVVLQGLGRHAEAAVEFRRALELRPDFAAAHNNLGITLRELREGDEALAHFRRAVELEPNFAQARTNLGQMLLDRGQAEESLPHCQEAVRLQPDLAPLHHNLGNALRALDKLVEARSAYLEALRLDPNLARAHTHLGQILQQEGKFDDALTWLKQAVALDANDADAWAALAELHDEREEPAEAIPCWERVLVLAPDRAAAHNSLGWALQEEGRLAEAGEHYRTALQLQPEWPGTQLNLGGLHEEQGEMAEAEAAFRTALKLQPSFALPYARLATLLRGKLPDADRAALEERLADPKLERGPRARLLFALAHVLDAAGDYARAADCLRQANALALELAKGKRDYSPADHERFVDGLIAAFTPEFFGRLAGAGLATRRPLFVFGLPRSGTTLIEQVLASHPAVHGAGELRLVRRSFEAIPSVLGRAEAPLVAIPHLDAAAVRRLAEQHLEKLNALGAGVGRPEHIVDKMPDNYMYLGLLALMFPQATFIHCRRDLRDIAVSCWMTDFRSIRWANDPDHLPTRFQQYGRLMAHWRAVLPAPVHDVAYEEAVADLESVARRLVAACGLDWHPACLEFHRTRRPIRTASVTQVRQPIYKQSVARWKNYETHLRDLFGRLSVGLSEPMAY
jgi:tetratricopeptide (TPR) repeat protein